MSHYLNISFVLVSVAAGGTLRAATKPHADRARDANRTWTNNDLKQLSKVPCLISIVGQPTSEAQQDLGAPAPRAITEETAWYAAQADSLNARLADEQASLREFTKALDDAQELKSMGGGINLAEDDIGITPEAALDILRDRVRETQSDLEALEDLARHNDIPPGILRDPWQGFPADTTITAVEQSRRDMSIRGGDL
jgi:hypothetical protein